MNPVVLLLISAVASAQAQTPASIELDAGKLDRLVLDKNDHVRAAARELESAQARTGHLLRSFLPRVHTNLGIERFDTGFFATMTEPFGEAATEVNLFRSGRDWLEDGIRNQNVEVTRSESENLVQEELLKARQRYWTLVYQRELSTLVNEALARNQEALAAANKRFGAGMGTATDQMDFEVNRTNLEQDLARIRLVERNTRRELNVLLGLDPTTELKTPEQNPHEHEDGILNQPFLPERHREIRALNARHEMARLSARKDWRWWTPSLDAFAGYTLFTFRERDYDRLLDRVDSVLGARLTFELFDGGSSRSEARSSERQSEAFASRAAQSQRELQARVQSAKDELKLVHDLVHGAEKNVTQARSYLQATLSEYRRGLKNSPDVFAANQRFLDAQRRLADLRRDYQLARADLQNLFGQ